MRSRPSSAGSRPPIATPRCSPPTRSIAPSPRSTGSGVPLADRPADGRARARRPQRRRRLGRRRPAGARGRARRRRGHAQALGRPARPTARRAAARPRRCSAPAALAHSLGDPAPDARSGAGVPRRGGRARSCAATRRAARPNPCVLCNGELRIDAMIALADRARRVEARHRPLRAASPTTGRARCWPAPPTAPRTRPTCSPALRAGVARAASLPARGADQAARSGSSRAQAGLEVAGRAESQDLCFLAGQGKREFLRRHAGLEDRPGEVVDRSGRRLGSAQRPSQLHRRPAARARRRAAASRSTCWRPTPTPTASSPAAATSSRRSRIRIRGAQAPPPGRARRRRPAPLPLAPDGSAGCEANGDPGEAIVALAEPVDRVAPGQVACLLDGDLVVGHGTIV